MNISKFKHFIKCRNQLGNRSSGGLSVYINKDSLKDVTYIPSENINIIWCKLDKTYFNFQKDICLGTVYLSPPNYEINNSEDLIGELEEEMFLFSQKGDIIMFREIIMHERVTFRKPSWIMTKLSRM